MGRYWAYRLAPLDPLIVGQAAPPYHIQDQSTTQTAAPRWLPWNARPPKSPDVVILAVKWRGMARVRDWLAQHAVKSLVISLMNGMGQEEALPSATLAAGITTAAVLRQDTRDVRGIAIHGLGETILPDREDWRMDALKAWSRSYDGNWRWTDHQAMLTRRWIKLVQNSIINPLSALADCPNGDLPNHPLWRLASPLGHEAEAVAEAIGIHLPRDLSEYARTLTEQTRDNLSSMLQDVRAGLDTEISAINGYIARTAKIHGMSAPTHEALTHLVQSLSSGRP